MFESLKDGLDTVVGKMGIRLSGGQRQRLSIARMILANPSVVILMSQHLHIRCTYRDKTFKNLEQFLKDKTVITIAHRLSTVKMLQKIFVLEDGELVKQSGTHNQLEEQEAIIWIFVKHQLTNS